MIFALILMSSSFRRRQRPLEKADIVGERRKLKADGVDGERST